MALEQLREVNRPRIVIWPLRFAKQLAGSTHGMASQEGDV